MTAMKRILTLAVLSVLVVSVNGAMAYAQTLTGPSDTIINNNPDNVIIANPPSEIPADPINPNLGGVITITPPDPSAYARLFVNESKLAYVEYGTSATLRWESNKMSSCTIEPTGQTGTAGQYLLTNITSNTQIRITCLTISGTPYSATGRSRDVNVTIKVLPPTFDYLRDYLSHLPSNNGKKVNLTSTSVMIDQAQKAYDSGKTDNAQSFLQKSVNNLKQQSAKGELTTAAITQYESAANYLSKTLPYRVVVAPDGCSVTATGSAGFNFLYQTNDGTGLLTEIGIGHVLIRSYNGQTTIPESGSVTGTLYYAKVGWTSSGVIEDADGLIYAYGEKYATADCPTP